MNVTSKSAYTRGNFRVGPHNREGTRLSDTVRELLVAPDLDSYMSEERGRYSAFLEMLFGTVERAFEGHQPDALFEVHRTLYQAYDEQVGRPRPGAGHNQYHPLIMRIRHEIEQAWARHEHARIDLKPADVPTDPTEFLAFLRERSRRHRLASHPFFEYVAKDATVEEIIEFFMQEGPIALRFCDLIALSLVGADDDVKAELADNFWDEVGNGNFEKRHTELYRRLLRYIGRDLPSQDALMVHCMDRLDWRGYAGCNLYFHLAVHRRNYFRSVGCLGIAEMMDPAQYEQIVQGCHRVGLTDDHQLAYYVDHVMLDKEHGDGWFDHVMAPLVKKHPEVAYEMAVGALMRMNTGADYYDSLLENLPRCAGTGDQEQRRAA